MTTITISIDAGDSSQEDIRDYMEELASSINIKNIMGDYKSFWQLKDYKITNGEDTLIHIYPDYNPLSIDKFHTDMDKLHQQDHH